MLFILNDIIPFSSLINRRTVIILLYSAWIATPFLIVNRHDPKIDRIDFQETLSERKVSIFVLLMTEVDFMN